MSLFKKVKSTQSPQQQALNYAAAANLRYANTEPSKPPSTAANQRFSGTVMTSPNVDDSLAAALAAVAPDDEDLVYEAEAETDSSATGSRKRTYRKKKASAAAKQSLHGYSFRNHSHGDDDDGGEGDQTLDNSEQHHQLSATPPSIQALPTNDPFYRAFAPQRHHTSPTLLPSFPSVPSNASQASKENSYTKQQSQQIEHPNSQQQRPRRQNKPDDSGIGHSSSALTRSSSFRSLGRHSSGVHSDRSSHRRRRSPQRQKSQKPSPFNRLHSLLGSKGSLIDSSDSSNSLESNLNTSQLKSNSSGYSSVVADTRSGKLLHATPIISNMEHICDDDGLSVDQKIWLGIESVLAESLASGSGSATDGGDDDDHHNENSSGSLLFSLPSPSTRGGGRRVAGKSHERGDALSKDQSGLLSSNEKEVEIGLYYDIHPRWRTSAAAETVFDPAETYKSPNDPAVNRGSISISSEQQTAKTQKDALDHLGRSAAAAAARVQGQRSPLDETKMAQKTLHTFAHFFVREYEVEKKQRSDLISPLESMTDKSIHAQMLANRKPSAMSGMSTEDRSRTSVQSKQSIPPELVGSLATLSTRISQRKLVSPDASTNSSEATLHGTLSVGSFSTTGSRKSFDSITTYEREAIQATKSVTNLKRTTQRSETDDRSNALQLRLEPEEKNTSVFEWGAKEGTAVNPRARETAAVGSEPSIDPTLQASWLFPSSQASPPSPSSTRSSHVDRVSVLSHSFQGPDGFDNMDNKQLADMALNSFADVLLTSQNAGTGSFHGSFRSWENFPSWRETEVVEEEKGEEEADGNSSEESTRIEPSEDANEIATRTIAEVVGSMAQRNSGISLRPEYDPQPQRKASTDTAEQSAQSEALERKKSNLTGANLSIFELFSWSLRSNIDNEERMAKKRILQRRETTTPPFIVPSKVSEMNEFDETLHSSRSKPSIKQKFFIRNADKLVEENALQEKRLPTTPEIAPTEETPPSICDNFPLKRESDSSEAGGWSRENIVWRKVSNANNTAHANDPAPPIPRPVVNATPAAAASKEDKAEDVRAPIEVTHKKGTSEGARELIRYRPLPVPHNMSAVDREIEISLLDPSERVAYLKRMNPHEDASQQPSYTILSHDGEESCIASVSSTSHESSEYDTPSPKEPFSSPITPYSFGQSGEDKILIKYESPTTLTYDKRKNAAAAATALALSTQRQGRRGVPRSINAPYLASPLIRAPPIYKPRAISPILYEQRGKTASGIPTRVDSIAECDMSVGSDLVGPSLVVSPSSRLSLEGINLELNHNFSDRALTAPARLQCISSASIACDVSLRNAKSCDAEFLVTFLQDIRKYGIKFDEETRSIFSETEESVLEITDVDMIMQPLLELERELKEIDEAKERNQNQSNEETTPSQGNADSAKGEQSIYSVPSRILFDNDKRLDAKKQRNHDDEGKTPALPPFVYAKIPTKVKPTIEERDKSIVLRKEQSDENFDEDGFETFKKSVQKRYAKKEDEVEASANNAKEASTSVLNVSKNSGAPKTFSKDSQTSGTSSREEPFKVLELTSGASTPTPLSNQTPRPALSSFERLYAVQTTGNSLKNRKQSSFSRLLNFELTFAVEKLAQDDGSESKREIIEPDPANEFHLVRRGGLLRPESGLGLGEDRLKYFLPVYIEDDEDTITSLNNILSANFPLGDFIIVDENAFPGWHISNITLGSGIEDDTSKDNYHPVISKLRNIMCKKKAYGRKNLGIWRIFGRRGSPSNKNRSIDISTTWDDLNNNVTRSATKLLTVEDYAFDRDVII